MNVTAKFQVVNNFPVEGATGNKVELSAVTGGSKENEEFFNLTPSGEIYLAVLNDATSKQFIVGKECLVTFDFSEKKEGLTFGDAIEALKQGKRVCRTGWNGKGMFIFMRPADEIRVDIVANNIKFLPMTVKKYYGQDLFDDNGNLLEIKDDDTVKFTAYLCLKSADGAVVNGWLATQNDILSEDWVILDN